MDESAFRSARDAMAPQPCAFQNAMLAGVCDCALAARRNIAEREAVACAAPAAREQCARLCALLRQNSAFALKLAQVGGPLPHSKEMKVECGGLLGVQQAIAATVPDADAAPAARASGLPAVVAERPSLADVHRLVQACERKFGGFANLPYSVIVQSVVAFQIRRRRPGR